MPIIAWSIESLCDAMVKAGFPRTVPVLQRGAAIVWAESGFVPTATNPKGISLPQPGAYGLWQIMYPTHASVFAGHTWSDGNDNTAMAYALYRDSGWSPWNGDGSQAYMSKVLPGVQNYLHGDPGEVTGGLGPIPNPLSGIEGAFTALTNLFGKAFDPNLWKRIGIGLLGAFLVMLGVMLLVRNEEGSLSKSIAPVAKTVMETAE